MRADPKFSRKVLHAYKESHWHTYWQAFLSCGHWGLASNRYYPSPDQPKYTYQGHAKTAICNRCQKGEAPDQKALDKFNAGGEP